MNSDPKKSAQPCGCDEGANHVCEAHQTHVTRALRRAAELVATVTPMMGSAQWRKERPLYSGCLAYFPDALMEVAYVSFKGNEQHNPGEPLHWAREKSTDHLDCCLRHLADHAKGTIEDGDMGKHLAKNAWRALAELQTFLEKERA
jgi:hypothetical protein